MLTHLDLFSGIGGFKLAAEWAGFETFGFSEVEPFACKLLKQHWPTIKNYGDITRADFSELTDRITVLTGGFPCQPWSTSGQQRGEADDRHLWPAMLDVIKSVRPGWIIGENVPGLVNMGKLDDLLDDLDETGYSSQSFIIPACGVGAVHKRDRLWIVANSIGLGSKRSIERMQENNKWGNIDASVLPSLSFLARSKNQLPSPYVSGKDDGISNRAHRIKGLGNAIVPQVVYPFFEFIKQLTHTLDTK